MSAFGRLMVARPNVRYSALAASTSSSSASIGMAARGLSTSVKESYTERMARTGRPVSPHVTVYRFPIVAISSITNRVTGVLLSVGVTGIGAATLMGLDAPALLQLIGSTPVAPIFKFAVAFPLTYHYAGGLRHIYWDKVPEAVTNEDVAKSSYLLFGGSGLVSLILAFVSF